jgi:hypothetical protein
MKRVINIDIVYDDEIITMEGVQQEISNILGVTQSQVILDEPLNVKGD